MKTMMMMICLVGMVGCAGNNAALQARVDAAEARQQSLHNQIEELQNSADSCTTAVAKLHQFEDYMKEQADKAWEATKARETAAEPGVKQTISDGIDSIEVIVKDNANKAYDATKNAATKWAQEHNLTK